MLSGLLKNTEVFVSNWFTWTRVFSDMIWVWADLNFEDTLTAVSTVDGERRGYWYWSSVVTILFLIFCYFL